ncbi:MULTISPECIES: pilus assembly protein PilP [Rheinheimera]|uniref:Pilus assembly protein PilP n=1 Tax=Rheinheimera marina TaxID=1774958 RepID=A0ABV9JMW4_9GAMM
MRIAVLLLISLTLSACFDNSDDIRFFMQEVQQQAVAKIPPLKPVNAFVHQPYQSEQGRSPFVMPEPVQGAQSSQSRAGCLQPEPGQTKQPLELVALDTLTMKGTLGANGQLWALLLDGSQKLHRVTAGDKLGLFYGEISRVRPDKIQIRELVPDGSGCFIRRETELQLQLPAAQPEPQTNGRGA